MFVHIECTKLGLANGYVRMSKSLQYSHTCCGGGWSLMDTVSMDRTRERLIYSGEEEEEEAQNGTRIRLERKGDENLFRIPQVECHVVNSEVHTRHTHRNRKRLLASTSTTFFGTGTVILEPSLHGRTVAHL